MATEKIRNDFGWCPRRGNSKCLERLPQNYV